ncbi:MAG: LPP20 family lipoprotein [Bdellovibrionales bacterium]|nr:LPP20 family lipoprotein [Bdellovibrionales bacterium]
MKSSPLILGLSILLSSCASAPSGSAEDSTPEWVRHPERRFSSERYLSAVGVGVDRESAIRDAKKNMAESFLVKVKSATSSESESKMSRDTGGGLQGRSDESLKKEVSFESVARLRGAEVKEVVTVGRESFALIALDRLAARSGLLLDANRIKAKLEAELGSLDEAYSAAGFQEAKKDLELLRELGSEAAVLGMGAILQIDPLENRFARMESSLRVRNRKLRFHVSTLKGDERFARNLEICIQEQGGTILSPDAPSDGAGRIAVSVFEQPQHLEVAGWVKIRFEVSASLVRADGKSIRISESRTETARSKEAVMEAVSDVISKSICEQAWSRLGELKEER